MISTRPLCFAIVRTFSKFVLLINTLRRILAFLYPHIFDPKQTTSEVRKGFTIPPRRRLHGKLN
jgi:hypothetical protein